MIVKASLHGLRIAEVPTTLKPDGRDRRPHLRTWRDGWRHLSFMLFFSPRWLFVYPGVVIMFIGLCLTLWLLSGPKIMFEITLDVHTLVYAHCMILLGFQAVLFGILSKVYAVTTGLIPKPPGWRKVFRRIRLETGLIMSALLLTAGIVMGLRAVGIWEQHDFRTLDPTQTLRLVIPSVSVITMGGEILLASFFFSVLGLADRNQNP